MPAFEKSEYLNRLRKVKESMREQNIDVLLVTDPANMNYLTGYDALSFYTPQGVVVSLEEEHPTWLGRGQDKTCADRTTWLDEEHKSAYPDYYLWEPEEQHVMDYVADYLIDKNLDKKVIGVEMDAYYFTAYWFERLKKRLSDASFEDATMVIRNIRRVKSDSEIEFMKRAAKIVEGGMSKAIDSIESGVRECDVAADIFHELISGTDEYGGNYPSLVPLMPSGEKSNAPHLTWTDDEYEEDQIVYLEMAGCYKRYHSPLSRTVYIGEPPEKVAETAKIVIEGLNAALEAIKPGATCHDVQAAWQDVISKHGLKKESRMGYSIGLSYPPVWDENTEYFRPKNYTVLKPNMAFHVMPGMWVDDFGVAFTEAIRVTEDGSEALADFPRKLFLK
jgi:Xaa-Pro dipeptidase